MTYPEVLLKLAQATPSQQSEWLPRLLDLIQTAAPPPVLDANTCSTCKQVSRELVEFGVRKVCQGCYDRILLEAGVDRTPLRPCPTCGSQRWLTYQDGTHPLPCPDCNPTGRETFD